MQTQTQVKKLDFKGQHIFAGIDVHSKSWQVSISAQDIMHKTYNQPPSPETLSKYLRKNFPGANYLCAYEAGFSGFWLHDQLKELGIDCM